VITVTGDTIADIIKQLAIVTDKSPITTVLAELSAGRCPRNKISAIKRLRELSGSTLVEAKDMIESSVAAFVWAQ
jgi:ribosomal protein L7/L12